MDEGGWVEGWRVDYWYCYLTYEVKLENHLHYLCVKNGRMWIFLSLALRVSDTRKEISATCILWWTLSLSLACHTAYQIKTQCHGTFKRDLVKLWYKSEGKCINNNLVFWLALYFAWQGTKPRASSMVSKQFIKADILISISLIYLQCDESRTEFCWEALRLWCGRRGVSELRSCLTVEKHSWWSEMETARLWVAKGWVEGSRPQLNQTQLHLVSSSVGQEVLVG